MPAIGTITTVLRRAALLVAACATTSRRGADEVIETLGESSDVDSRKAKEAFPHGGEAGAKLRGVDKPALEHRAHIAEVGVQAAFELCQGLQAKVEMSGSGRTSTSRVEVRQPTTTADEPPTR